MDKTKGIVLKKLWKERERKMKENKEKKERERGKKKEKIGRETGQRR